MLPASAALATTRTWTYESEGQIHRLGHRSGQGLSPRQSIGQCESEEYEKIMSRGPWCSCGKEEQRDRAQGHGHRRQPGQLLACFQRAAPI